MKLKHALLVHIADTEPSLGRWIEAGAHVGLQRMGKTHLTINKKPFCL